MTPAASNMRITRNTRARMRGIYKYTFYLYKTNVENVMANDMKDCTV